MFRPGLADMRFVKGTCLAEAGGSSMPSWPARPLLARFSTCSDRQRVVAAQTVHACVGPHTQHMFVDVHTCLSDTAAASTSTATHRTIANSQKSTVQRQHLMTLSCEC
jgi:hypothetical protein